MRDSRTAAVVRTLVLAIGILALGLAAASAQTSCAPAAEAGVERCVSGLSAATLSRMFEPQEASNWCWAASLAMILRRYGVDVPQEQIVRTAFGAPANQRASAAGLSDLVRRSWRDADGNMLAAVAQPIAPWHRGLGVEAPEVIQDLDQGKPLLMGAQQHAMVLVQVTYERRVDGNALTPAGVRMLRALVLDPASGQWLRTLPAAERRPEFLARISVEPHLAVRSVALAQAEPLQ